jgi:putative transferase (TIGR04331 family)
MSCKTDNFNNKKYLTILTYSIVPYFLPRRPYSNDDSRIFYIKNISLLINSLNYDISINLRDQIRSYKSDIFNTIIKNIKKDNIFIDKEKYFLKSINKSKLVVCTYDSTTYLQTLNLNIPTIIIFSNKITNVIAKPYYDKLKKAGILFDNPLEAAKKINAVYADVDKWWKDKDIQQVVNLFCYHFSRRTKNPAQELYKSFSKVIENVKN